MGTRALLASVQLEHLVDAFEAAGVDPASIDSLSDETLIALGATLMGDRARLRARFSKVGAGLTVVAGPHIELGKRVISAGGTAIKIPRGIVLKVGSRELVWWLRDRVQMGRTTSEGADLLLAVEPFFPRERYLDNYDKSYRISRVHLTLEHRDDGVYVTPLGQAGIVVNGVPAMLKGAFRAQDSMELVVADVLTLVVRALNGSAAIQLARHDNRTELSYVIGARHLGLFPWYGEVELLAGEDADQAPIYLTVEGYQVLASSTGSWTGDGVNIAPGALVDLREGFSGEAEDGSWAFTIDSFIW